MGIVFEIMHRERRVARIDTNGHCKIFFSSFMPYNLYLEEQEDFDTLVNNISNFYHWCASRVLTLDRQHAKAILNSANLKQAVTDRDRAFVALTYRCLSLIDVFWVRRKGEKVAFADVNLFENHLDNAFIDIALKGNQYTVQNEYLSRDLSTNGCFPKAWRRSEKGFQLLKDGSREVVEKELLASQICRCFDVNQVIYTRDTFAGECVSVSYNMTSLDYSIVPIEAYDTYCANHNRNLLKSILRLDKKNYYMMNIIDYLVGNTDRHWGNWGLLVDNKKNKPDRLHDLMDFNQAFNSYDTIDGANCQTIFGKKITQREAAIQAVHAIGLNQLKEIDFSVFNALPEYRSMFERRLALLKNNE